ncbi:MAG TPA: type II toxin-antitoxin system antitoxin, RelB/DinJ family [Ruminococcaceae bacterium]|jgi:addiction module RelB/DinJ family antitoxin|nr:type II toxin-antitoxin system antitoxin, RelB/DinJ family [Oscillospiraceae bacterium]HCM23700.1 type II toxin-antitoxin system antitoxin, RelB/DinJ family [Oscillospiraceae bacterium]
MASKTANVLARVEPDVKEQAEAIMAKLGIPASVVINMLYKQIIMTKGIPFPLSVPATLKARDEMDSVAFNAMMQRGLNEAKSDRSRPVADVFSELRREIQ